MLVLSFDIRMSHTTGNMLFINFILKVVLFISHIHFGSSPFSVTWSPCVWKITAVLKVAVAFPYMQHSKCLWINKKCSHLHIFNRICWELGSCKTPKRSGVVNLGALSACFLWISALALIFRVSHLFLPQLSQTI